MVAVAWLVVLGAGTWGYADRNCKMRTFKAGVHRVGQETVDFALLEAGPRSRVIVTAEEPKLTRRQLQGPLSPRHFSMPADGGVMLKPMVVAGSPEPDDAAVPFEFSCLHCPRRFPSPQALDRHVSRNH